MNKYRELKNKQQEEFNKFPMIFAFSNKQFEEGMKELGLSPNDTDKIYKAPGGGFYRKEDAPKLHEMTEKFEREMQEAISADKTGDGFIFDMFYCELADHECGYTGDYFEALDVLGYTFEEVAENKALAHGFNKAVAKINREEF